MFIHEMFQQKPCVFSVEVFPPKKAGAAEETLYPVLRELCTLGPDYISVTYGAGGGTAGQSTAKIASYIKNGLHVEALAHLTCVNSTRVQVEETLTRLREDNVENVLALRGDINPDLPRRMDFLHSGIRRICHRRSLFRRGLRRENGCLRLRVYRLGNVSACLAGRCDR